MLNKRSQTDRPETGGPAQLPDESSMLSKNYNPTDLAGDVDSGPDGIGVASGSPTMEPDTEHLGNGDTLGNNDGTEPDPEMSDPMPS